MNLEKELQKIEEMLIDLLIILTLDDETSIENHIQEIEKKLEAKYE